MSSNPWPDKSGSNELASCWFSRMVQTGRACLVSQTMPVEEVGSGKDFS